MKVFRDAARDSRVAPLSAATSYLATLFAGLIALFSATAHSQTSLTFNNLSLAVGDSGVASADISVDGAAVALQFDLLYDPAVVSIGTVTGGSALTPNHSIASNPISSGRERVIVTSAPVTPLMSGTLATINLAVSGSAVAGTSFLRWDAVVIGDAAANPITPASLTDGVITITAAPTTPGPATPIPSSPLWSLVLLTAALIIVTSRTRRGGPRGTLAFAVLLLLGPHSSLVNAQGSIPGDANGDGVVDSRDVQIIIERILERGVLPGNGDCNEDSAINVLDTICSQLTFVPGETTPIILGPGNRSIPAETAFEMYLFAADPDPGATQSWEKVSGPAALSVSSAGLLTWTPMAGDVGDNTVRVRVRDDTARSAESSFTITVFQLAPSPAANGEPQLTPPGDQNVITGGLFDLQLNATDPDGDSDLTFSLVSAPTAMVIDERTGALSWLTTDAPDGPVDVVVRVMDSAGASDFASFVIQVEQPDGAPIGRDDIYSAFVGGTTSVASEQGVLSNDSDPNDDPMRAVLLTDSTPGELVLEDDGSFSYTPLTPVILTAPQQVEGNLVQLAGPVRTQVSSSATGVRRDRVVDGDSATSWFTANGDAANLGASPFVDLAFPQDVTVERLAILGDRESPGTADVVEGVFQLFNRQGEEIYNSGAIALPLPNRDITLTIDPVQGIRRARFTFTDDVSASPGIAEFEVYGLAEKRRYKNAESVLLTQNSPIETSATSENNAQTQKISFAADQDERTFWSARADDTAPQLDIRFVAGPVTVTRMEIEGPKSGSGAALTSNAFETARLVLLDESDVELWDSGVIDLTADPERDATVVVPSIAGVHKARFEGLSVAIPTNHGFAEFRVFGDGPVWPIRPIEEWTWELGTALPGQENVANTPLVVDLDGDGNSELVFAAGSAGNFFNDTPGNVVVLDARTGAELAVATDSALQVNAAASMAAGDLDGDGLLEIVAVSNIAIDGWRLVCFEHDLSVKWFSDAVEPLGFGALAIADIDATGLPEVIVGRQVINADDGSLRWTGTVEAGDVPIVADIDLDGEQELISGSGVYSPDGSLEWSESRNLDWNTAVANLDSDPFGEVVFVTDGLMSIYNHDGSLANAFVYPGALGGGPPTIADFDGDGQAEIGVLRSANYVVYESDGYILWQQPVEDGSRRTGSVVLDLDGDGAAEAVHRDERFLRIYRGIDGEVLYQSAISSTTANESPVAADIDGDGQVELVVTGTQFGFFGRKGVFAFGGFDEDWAKTRSIWNQHAYSISNVNEDGSIPAQPVINWLSPGLNNFRQNGYLPEDDSRFERFTYRVEAGGQFSNETTVSIDTRTPNGAPEIVSTPDLRATVNFEYLTAVSAIDPDFDPLSFELVEGPSGMSIDSTTGLLRWTPGSGDLGVARVAVIVTDAGGLSAFQRFELVVGDQVAVPNVVGLARFTARTDLVNAELNEGRVAFANHPTIGSGLVISQFPSAGATVEAGTGVALNVSSGPGPLDTDDDGDGLSENAGDCNDNDAAIFPGAADAGGDGIDQDCDGLDGSKTLIAIEITPGSKRVATDEIVELTATGIFEDGSAQNLSALVTWVNGPTFTQPAAGSFAVEASFRGVSASASIEVLDAVVDSQPPMARIETPEAGDTVTDIVEVTGTASDSNFLRYELSLGVAGRDDFQLIAEGDAPVTDAALGQFDPTVLINDLYTLRLTVFDRGGNQSFTETTVQVDENYKPGQFGFSFVDLNMPISGLPLTVLRNYDSREKGKGDFGVGWTLDIRSIRLSKNRVLGSGWLVQKAGFAFVLLATDEHKVSVTLPDGRVEEFDLVVSPNQSAVVPFPPLANTARFVPRPGTRGELQTLENTNLTILDSQPGEIELLDDEDSSVFNPDRFVYTAQNGAQIFISASGGVEKIVDINGNSIDFGPNGMQHSSGASIAFVRDDADRITEIVDANGNAQQYLYDGNGDLIRHTDREGNSTDFLYDADHNLLEIIAPAGEAPTRYEYDDSGRLVKLIDAEGNETLLDHRLDSRQEVITDRTGATIVRAYDERGNMLSETDGLGNTRTFTYDTQGNILTRTDKEGNTWTYEYNSDGQPTREIDPLGNEIQREFDDRGNLVTYTDELGEVTRHNYDARGNLTETIDPEGGRRSFAYDQAGNLIASEDENGNRVELTLDPLGRVITEAFASGDEIEYERDAMGMPVTMRFRSLTELGERVDTWRHSYDANGNRISTESPDGGPVVITRFDENQQIVGGRDGAGIDWSMARNLRGDVTSNKNAFGSGFDAEYDAEGRQTQIQSSDYAPISRNYDAAGEVESLQVTGAAPMAFGRDRNGRPTSFTDTAGNSRDLNYDALGRVTTSTNGKGAQTQRFYNARGDVERFIDLHGNAYRHEYDGLGRLVRTIKPNGLSIDRAYDAAGNVVTSEDTFGSAFTHTYDALNSLVSTTDALGNRYQWSRNSRGEIQSLTTAKGSVWRYAHDVNGDMVSVIAPDGSQAEFERDGLGRITQLRRFSGALVGFNYDDASQAVRVDHDGLTVDYEFDRDGNLLRYVSPTFTTELTYDSAARIISRSSDNALSADFRRDGTGRITALETARGVTSYQYDRDNFTEEVDFNGLQVSYERSPAGLPLGLELATGLRISSTLTELSLPEQISVQPLASPQRAIDYRYDEQGRVERIERSGGPTSSYAYDAAGRLVSVARQTGGAPASQTTYTYDADGNIANIEIDGASTAFTYDANDRLLRAGAAQYSWDPDGNLLSASRGPTTEQLRYDSLNRLVSYSRSGADPVEVTYTYHDDGLLRSRCRDAVCSYFLWDRESGEYPMLAEELDDNGDLIRRYINNEMHITHAVDAAGNVTVYFNDHLGSPIEIMDDQGNTQTRIEYDAYGNLLSGTPGLIGWSNMIRDPDSGMLFMRSRWYSPGIRRFIHMDSAAPDPMQPASVNRYLYAAGDPLNRVDPSGQQTLISQSAATQIASGLQQLGTTLTLGAVGGTFAQAFLPGGAFRGPNSPDAKFIPLGIQSANFKLRGPLGVAAGFETIHIFPTDEYATYFFIGPSVGTGKTTAAMKRILGVFNSTALIGSSVIFNVANAGAYEGFFASVTFSGNGFWERIQSLARGYLYNINAGSGVSIFAAPGSEYTDEQGRLVRPAWGARTGSALRTSSGSAFSVSFTYYWHLFSLGGQ